MTKLSKSPRKWLMILIISILLSGCAYRNAINRGNALAARGDWRGALAEYDKALRIDPDEEEAQKLRDQARPLAIKMALGDGQRSLSRQDYETAAMKNGSPFWGGVALLFICASFYHAHLGLQVVIEDYIGSHGARLVTIILVRAALILLGLIAALSVLRLMLA